LFTLKIEKKGLPFFFFCLEDLPRKKIAKNLAKKCFEKKKLRSPFQKSFCKIENFFIETKNDKWRINKCKKIYEREDNFS